MTFLYKQNQSCLKEFTAFAFYFETCHLITNIFIYSRVYCTTGLFVFSKIFLLNTLSIRYKLFFSLTCPAKMNKADREVDTCLCTVFYYFNLINILIKFWLFLCVKIPFSRIIFGLFCMKKIVRRTMFKWSAIFIHFFLVKNAAISGLKGSNKTFLYLVQNLVK